MVGLRMVLVACALVATLMAGCADQAGETPRSEIQQSLENVDVKATSTKGAIRGVVVDDAIKPIEAAVVSIPARQVSVTTGADGLFAFKDLEPGVYFLNVTAPGFYNVQQSAEMAAGRIVDIRVLMTADLTPMPFHRTMSFDGFAQAGNGLVNQAWELFVNGTAGVPVNSCECQFYFTTEAEPVSFIIEVTWERSVDNPASDSSGYWAIWDDGGPDGSYEDDGCGNPCYGRADAATFALPETRDFHTDIWLDSDWFYVNQDFKQFVTVFYLEPAPEGWSFVNGDP